MSACRRANARGRVSRRRRPPADAGGRQLALEYARQAKCEPGGKPFAGPRFLAACRCLAAARTRPKCRRSDPSRRAISPPISPTARATRIPNGEAPTIDGDLNDPAWAKAEVIDEFYQVDPNAGQPATQPTIARFMYDDENLYVGIYAYDSEPDRIVATLQARDGSLDVDDRVRIYIDPELTRRNAYYFEMNALGARVDALIQNNYDLHRHLEHDLGRRREAPTRRLLRRNGDPVPRPLLRSGEPELGSRDPAPHPAHGRSASAGPTSRPRPTTPTCRARAR